MTGWALTRPSVRYQKPRASARGPAKTWFAGLLLWPTRQPCLPSPYLPTVGAASSGRICFPPPLTSVCIWRYHAACLLSLHGSAPPLLQRGRVGSLALGYT